MIWTSELVKLLSHVWLFATLWTAACQASLSITNSQSSLVGQRVKRLPAMRETRLQSLGWEDPLEKEIATHCSILAWRIPQMEEPGRLQSMGSQRVRHNWVSFIHQRNWSLPWQHVVLSQLNRFSFLAFLKKLHFYLCKSWWKRIYLNFLMICFAIGQNTTTEISKHTQ